MSEEDEYNYEEDEYNYEEDYVGRLIRTIHKLSKISGVEISELIEENYLQEGDV